ncbi:MAG: hypothetical protein NVS4B9_39210 [Ktedonobacteraceae bacterium]
MSNGQVWNCRIREKEVGIKTRRVVWAAQYQRIDGGPWETYTRVDTRSFAYFATEQEAREYLIQRLGAKIFHDRFGGTMTIEKFSRLNERTQRELA